MAFFLSRINSPIVTNLRWHKKREKDIFGIYIVTIDLIGLLPTNHIIDYIKMALTEVFENTKSHYGSWKCLKQRKIFEILLSELSRVYWRNCNLRRLSGRFHTLIWRLREKRSKNWSLPDYPGEVTALLVAQAVAQTFLLRSRCIWSKDKYAHKAEHRAFEIVPWLLIRMRVLMYVRT